MACITHKTPSDPKVVKRQRAWDRYGDIHRWINKNELPKKSREACHHNRAKTFVLSQEAQLGTNLAVLTQMQCTPVGRGELGN
jgi:hypothetical protein